MSNPLTLAIDTATSQVGVAIGRASELIASVAVDRGRVHGELLAPSIKTVLHLASVELRDIELIAVDNGPGLFTGLRVGVATAKALASALKLKIVPCSSLDILAFAHRSSDRAVAAVVDAKRGEVFWRIYRPAGEGMRPTDEPRVGKPEELADALEQQSAKGPLIATGDGARRYADTLGAVDGVVIDDPERQHPSAVSLVGLAAARPGLCPDDVVAEYLRGPDVRIGWEQRDG